MRSGDGGNGCKSVYRDKYTREGIPNGGPGGKGADVIIRADRNLHTLMDLRYNKHFYGHKGENGSSNGKKGRDLEATIIRVPCGTLIKDSGVDCILGSLDHDGQELIVAHGGRGGLGNRHKYDATPGTPGEEKELVLDLKVIADVGIVGFPNVGKSTLVSVISSAHPAIAAYPFTTKTPVLGVVGKTEATFVIADIPGLIEGSSDGKGLGDKFLRHVERTKILVHLIDMAGFEGRDPLADYKAINKELKNYDPAVFKKPQVIVANKMDLPQARENLKKFKKAVRKPVIAVSALNKEGLEDLVEAIRKKLSADSNKARQ